MPKYMKSFYVYKLDILKLYKSHMQDICIVNTA